MSMGPLYVFFGEASMQVLCSFFSWIVYLLDVESYEFFILEIKPLSELSLAYMFSHNIGSLFILMMVQKLFSRAEAF